MKKNLILAVLCLIISAMTFAQVPQKMSYQAVVRGNDNNLVTNSEISVRISILQGNADGEAIYTETHSATTNANGLVTIEIGDGSSSDDFSAINWANGPYFVKTETDVNGGDNYDVIGVSQLLSVPYAMYAQTAGNVPDVSGFLTEETDPTVSEWAKAENKPIYNYSEIEDTPEIPTVPTNVSEFENDANYVVTEADPTVPAWAKAENKPIYNYSEIEGTPEIPTVPTNVSAFENDANYLTSYTETQNIADVASLGNSVNTQLKNVTDPTENQDAATKKYVDEIIATMQAQNAELQETIEHLNIIVRTGHDFVDLGLPSGTLWATCNVGATNPEDFGDYFAWGETTTRGNYIAGWSAYQHCNGSRTNLTKYCNDANYGYNGFTDNLTTLERSDDAATANWGAYWRMPTNVEMEELWNNCSHEWTTLNGVTGCRFTGNNGNSIFFPAAGSINDSPIHVDCAYWTSSLDCEFPLQSWVLGYNPENSSYGLNRIGRQYGRSVRAICILP